ncbi:MAG TPA: choice-of-anchor V domain-containing protein [Chitinophagales bacterium]|nr:choice-of-anchor V domain-containing protein [Chitinophagales bacterium]
MNKKLLFSFFFIALIASLNIKTANSDPQKPPVGASGDPLTGKTCAQNGCHPSPAQAVPATGEGALTLNIGTGNPTTPLTNGFAYTPGTTYNIGFGITSSTGRYGFQMSSLNANNQQAGKFAVTTSSNTQLDSAGGFYYIGHRNAGNNKNWVYKWTAPANGGPVTLYYAYNTADNNGESSGDVIYNGSVTLTAPSVGIASISEKLSGLNVFPNPINNQFSMSFNLNEASRVSAQLYSLDGKEVQELMNEKVTNGDFNRPFDVSALPSGIYLMKLNVGDASVTQKIVKQ